MMLLDHRIHKINLLGRKITQEFENGVGIMLEICDLEEIIIINEDMNFNGIFYIMENGNCVVDGTYSGTWENLEDSRYRVTSDGDQASSLEATVTFSGNTMKTVINDEDGEFKQILIRQ